MLSPPVCSSGFLHLLEFLPCVILRLRVVEELFDQRTFPLCTRQVTARWFPKWRLRRQDCSNLFQEQNQVVCSFASAVGLRTAKYFGKPFIPFPSPSSFR